MRTIVEKEITQKMKKIKLDLDNLPSSLKTSERIEYKPSQRYDNTNHKIYHYVNLKDMPIYITQAAKTDETEKKYKLAEPIINYLQPDNKKFQEMLKLLDIEKLKEIEKEQKQFQKKLPFEVKFENNNNWGIYYSQEENRYFMMLDSNQQQVEPLFYLIKKQIELENTKKQEFIYVPINNIQYSNGVLRKSEIADLENYLWNITGEWPNIYEIKQKDDTKEIQIIGKVKVYNNIESFYKMNFIDKEEAQKFMKLVKTVSTIKTNVENEYTFQTEINEKGELCFYYNHQQITYKNLRDFIKKEVDSKKQQIQEILNENILKEEKIQMLKEIIAKQNIEYLEKEKQIVTFLECKKTFFGKLSYFFKSKKKKKTETKITKKSNASMKVETNKEENFEEKHFYRSEDLVKICLKLKEKEKELKDKKREVKVLENRKENLERKIKNATIYINEIESHRKSIFDFWKFTNKDAQQLITEAEEQEDISKQESLKPKFSYEEEIEKISKKIDKSQRNLFSKLECDAIFEIYQDLQAFQIDRKEKKLKRDDKTLEKSIEERGLEISLEQYKENIHNYQKILEDAYLRMVTPCDIKAYKSQKDDTTDQNWIILNMNAKEEIKNIYGEKGDKFILNCINIKENMQAIFYSNVIFENSLNKTLQEGMDESKKVLLDLKQYELKLKNRRDFYINHEKNQYENEIKLVQFYEYDIERRKGR